MCVCVRGWWARGVCIWRTRQDDDWTGLDWTGLDWTGLNCTQQRRTKLTCCCFFLLSSQIQTSTTSYDSPMTALISLTFKSNMLLSRSSLLVPSSVERNKEMYSLGYWCEMLVGSAALPLLCCCWFKAARLTIETEDDRPPRFPLIVEPWCGVSVRTHARLLYVDDDTCE